jgi:hypothetical protein
MTIPTHLESSIRREHLDARRLVGILSRKHHRSVVKPPFKRGPLGTFMREMCVVCVLFVCVYVCVCVCVSVCVC